MSTKTAPETPNAGGRYVRVGAKIYRQGEEPKRAARKPAKKPATRQPKR